MNAICLASSSAGNAYLLEIDRKDQEPVRLLVEAGITYQELNKKLALEGKNLNHIDAVLITHGHQDHCRSRKYLIKRGKRVYGNHSMASDEDYVLAHGQSKYVANNTLVTAISVEHDVEDPLAFVIQTDTTTVLFATDLKYFKSDLSNIKFDYIFLESNYDGQTIHFARKKAIEQGMKYDILRYDRIVNSHMSITNAVNTLKKMNLTRCKAIFLMHLSDRHANELLFKKRVQEELKTNCFVCKKNGGFV